MTERSNHGFEFGPQRVGVSERLLRRGDEEVNLSHNIYKLDLAVLDPLSGKREQASFII
jgi:hypothetical protein